MDDAHNNQKLNAIIVSDKDEQVSQLSSELETTGFKLNYQHTDTIEKLYSELDRQKWDVVISHHDILPFNYQSDISTLHPQFKSVPLILYADQTENASMVNAMRCGVKEFITKDTLYRLAPAIERERYNQKIRNVSDRHEERYKEIIDMSSDGILALDSNWVITLFSHGAEKMFGYMADEIIGKPYATLLDASDLTVSSDDVNTPTTTEQFDLTKRRDVSIKCKDGSSLAAEMNMSRSNVKGEERTYTVLLRDIRDRKARENKLEEMANFDALTGIYNRRSFYQQLELEIQRAEQDSQMFAIMYIDLDGFKPINDNLGHDAGDVVLQKLAGRLKKGIRHKDTVARLGGDEFIIILHDIRKTRLATKVAEKIIETFEVPFNVKGEKITTGASIGISIYPEHASRGDDLVRCADEALYEAKNNGKNTYRLYSKPTTRAFSAENIFTD